MTKIRIEVCIISARGLGRSPTLLKPQWFAVAWIDPNSKYCTKINSSGNLNPTWKTMFSFNVDERSSNLQELSLNVEIHKREPIFLREKLHGTATIMLKEFLAKFSTEGDAFKPIIEETGSFQLRKQNSGRPQGFVDISLHISEDREDVHSYPAAVKPTAESSQWAHILCVLLVPKVFFQNLDGKEGIDCSQVPAKRWGVACYLYELNRGCCIDCSHSKCGLGFHDSYGLDKGLCIEYKEVKGVGIVAGFCEEHTELWKKVLEKPQ